MKNIDNFTKQRENILELLTDLLDNNQNENSKEELLNLLHSLDYHDEFMSDITNEELFQKSYEFVQNSYENRDIEGFSKKLDRSIRKRRIKSLIPISVAGVAAAILLLIFNIFNWFEKDVNSEIISNNIISEDFKKPTMIIDNNYVSLGSQAQAIIKDDEYVAKVASTKKTQKQIKVSKSAIKKVIIPKGYIYTIILNDGSEITLNANSTLTYPSDFDSDERRVEFEGEGYFKISKNPDKPFIVECGESTLKVYGTEFNVRHESEESLQAILVSGSIGVKPGESKEVILEPNQLLSYNMDNEEISIETVNPYDYLQWLEGAFSYNQQPLTTILDDVSSWYGVKFNIDDNIDLESFVIQFYSKKESIDKTLGVIEMITDLKFINEGNNEYKVTNK